MLFYYWALEKLLLVVLFAVSLSVVLGSQDAFAGSTFGGTPVFPTCTPGPDPDGGGPLTQTPDAVLITGISEEGVLGGMDPANGVNGGGSFSYTFIGDPDGTGPQLPMLQFTEVWTTSARSYVMICGLDTGDTDYQIKKIITNNTPADSWPFFDNELLDPCCTFNDQNSDQLPENYVSILNTNPANPDWSHSNDSDGLSFAMGTQDALRTSTQWSPPLFVNEVGTVDFINFGFPVAAVGEMNPGEVDNPMSFAVRESQDNEQPFILTQAPTFVGGHCGGELFPCFVGGEFLGVDTTSLLVAGAQNSAAWMIPVIVSAIGIGIVIARKF